MGNGDSRRDRCSSQPEHAARYLRSGNRTWQLREMVYRSHRGLRSSPKHQGRLCLYGETLESRLVRVGDVCWLVDMQYVIRRLA